MLTPYSSIYPYMIPSIVNGFYSAIPQKHQNLFQFIPEYVGQGSHKTYTDAVAKLLNFNNVDVVSGLVSYMSLPDLISMTEKRQKLGFFFDIGEYIPHNIHLSNSVFINSLQFWQAEYALGYWANKTFGDKGMVIMPVYDAGYHLHSAFRQGTIAAGSSCIDYKTLTYIDGKSQVKDRIEPVLEEIKKDPPSYLHSIFCGTEAVEFLDAFKKSGLHKIVPLVLSTHMASDEIIQQVLNLNLEFYSASMWNFDNPDEINNTFKKRYINQTGNKPNVFSVLGYETGLAFYSMYAEFKQKEWGKVIHNLKTIKVNSPRGLRNFYLNSNYSTPVISIEKITTEKNNIRKFIVEQGQSLRFDNIVFSEIHNENVSGWQNPYLCV